MFSFSAFTVLCSRSAGTFGSIASSMLTLFRMMLGTGTRARMRTLLLDIDSVPAWPCGPCV
jgi:hypothetical protein